MKIKEGSSLKFQCLSRPKFLLPWDLDKTSRQPLEKVQNFKVLPWNLRLPFVHLESKGTCLPCSWSTIRLPSVSLFCISIAHSRIAPASARHRATQWRLGGEPQRANLASVARYRVKEEREGGRYNATHTDGARRWNPRGAHSVEKRSATKSGFVRHTAPCRSGLVISRVKWDAHPEPVPCVTTTCLL